MASNVPVVEHSTQQPDDAIMPALAPNLDTCTEPSEWLDDIVTRYHVPLFRYAYRLAGNPHDAQDLTQATFLTALERRGQVEHADRIQSWLFAILRNRYLDQLRRKRPELTEKFDSPPYHLGTSAPEEIDAEALQNAVSELPPEFRVVVLMYYFEELPYREIATTLEVPLGTVMSRLSRAKSHLRRRLEPAHDPPTPPPQRSPWDPISKSAVEDPRP